MKKHFLLGLLAGTALMGSTIFLGAQYWDQADWPSDSKIVLLQDSPAGHTLCEVLSTSRDVKRIILRPSPDEQGRLPGCMLQVHGEVNANGDFEGRHRPQNPFSVAQWHEYSTDKYLVNKNKAVGVCGLLEYMQAKTTLKGSESCMKLVKAKLAIQNPK